MKKFEVEFVLKRYVVITVEADDREAAEATAVEVMASDPRYESAELVTTWVSEVQS